MDNYIPFHLRVLINQIDPRLDLSWEAHLKRIFEHISIEDQHKIAKQILAGRGIHWDAETHRFSFKKKLQLEGVVEGIVHTGMRNLGQKVLKSLDQLKEYQDVHQIADYLESVIAQIDRIDVEENLELQRTKKTIREEFIYAAAAVIKAKTQLLIPNNARQITADIMKSFILEVYLKERLLGFWFRRVQPRQLAEDPNPLLNGFLRQNQRMRQLEVVKTSTCIFALSPSRDADVNPFSIRRFLNEERLFGSDNLYLNGAVIELHTLDHPENVQSFQWQINRIITIQRQISQQVIELVDEFELYNSQQLVPLLFSALDSSGLIAEKVIQQRLLDFEKNLSIHILERLEHALRHMVTNDDECEFLFISMRQLMADIISYFKDFQSQPAVMFDNQANVFAGRLVAYLTLIEKRRFDVFAMLGREDWNQNIEKINEPLILIQQLIKEALEKQRGVQKDIAEQQRLLAEKKNSFFAKLLKTEQNIQAKIVTLKHDLFELRQQAYFDIVRVPKKYPQYTVYLEFESLISINDKERHYAFASGKQWVTRLPIFVQLPEERSSFNLQVLHQSLQYDLTKMNQKWSTTYKD